MEEKSLVKHILKNQPRLCADYTSKKTRNEQGMVVTASFTFGFCYFFVWT